MFNTFDQTIKKRMKVIFISILFISIQGFLYLQTSFFFLFKINFVQVIILMIINQRKNF